jgi:hypothetical protein
VRASSPIQPRETSDREQEHDPQQHREPADPSEHAAAEQNLEIVLLSEAETLAPRCSGLERGLHRLRR